MVKVEQLSLNIEELIIEKAEEVPDGESISIDFFDVKAFSNKTIKSCQGDLFIICNVLCDYCDILERKVKDEHMQGLRKANFEYYVRRCRCIYKKLADQMGYDRDKNIEKCLKERAKKASYNDIGEDAMVMFSKGKKGL
nr:MAG TPA: hypothetical protein [Caudoviricetes sp.]